MRRTILASLVWAMALGGPGAGCDRPRVEDAGPGLSLEATVARMRALHQDGAYAALRHHIDSAGREEVIDLLLALDQLMVANRAALRAVRAACPACPASAYDLSFLADELELFAPRLRIVDARETGESGLVLAQVADRVPLVELRFQRRDARWVYLPGEADRELPRVVTDLARALERVASQLTAAGTAEPPEVEREYRYRVGRRLRKAAAGSRELRQAPASAAEPS